MIEPRNELNGKVDGVETAGRQNLFKRYGEFVKTSPGSKSQAFYTMTTRQPGRPLALSWLGVWLTSDKKLGGQMARGESDHRILYP